MVATKKPSSTASAKEASPKSSPKPPQKSSSKRAMLSSRASFRRAAETGGFPVQPTSQTKPSVNAMLTKRGIVKKLLFHEAPTRMNIVRRHNNTQTDTICQMDLEASVANFKGERAKKPLSTGAIDTFWVYAETLIRTLVTQSAKAAIASGQRTVKPSTLFSIIREAADAVDSPALYPGDQVVGELLEEGRLNLSTQCWDSALSRLAKEASEATQPTSA